MTKRAKREIPEESTYETAENSKLAVSPESRKKIKHLLNMLDKDKKKSSLKEDTQVKNQENSNLKTEISTKTFENSSPSFKKPSLAKNYSDVQKTEPNLNLKLVSTEAIEYLREKEENYEKLNENILQK